MTIEEMFGQSAVLTMLGMAIVFAFLTLIIISVTWAGKLIHTLENKNKNKEEDQ
jgi:Na+-transporting methylmalonyl-CoA/oxaloacetate decarboxylase gamma subunit